MLTNNNSKLGQILNCVPSEPGKSEKKILLFVQNQLKDLTGQQDLLKLLNLDQFKFKLTDAL
jgi:hypothetical protein